MSRNKNATHESNSFVNRCSHAATKATKDRKVGRLMMWAHRSVRTAYGGFQPDAGSHNIGRVPTQGIPSRERAKGEKEGMLGTRDGYFSTSRDRRAFSRGKVNVNKHLVEAFPNRTLEAKGVNKRPAYKELLKTRSTTRMQDGTSLLPSEGPSLGLEAQQASSETWIHD